MVGLSASPFEDRTVMKATLAPLLFVIAATARGQSAPDSVDPARVQTVDACVAAAMAKHHIPGVSVAVMKDGKRVLAKGYGLADVELNVPATEETVYQLASVTKTFTASAVMMLAKDGKLGLDDKVADRVKNLPDAWKDVTVRHLLNHTSGIKSYTSVDGFEKQMRKDFAPREILEMVAKEPLVFPPGDRWEYSNTGYFLLGLVIEEAAGKPYGEVLTERIFRPLGMSRTRVNDLRAIIPGRAKGYGRDGDSLTNGEYVSPTQPFSAGALVSTVADLAKWDAALTAGSPLDHATLDQMWTPAKLNGGGEAEYGLGWQVTKIEGHRSVAHGGGIPGFSTQITRFPDDKLSVIVLTNLEGGRAESLARGIAAVFIPDLAEKPAVAIADDDPETTGRLRSLFDGAAKGEVDPALFTEDAGKVLVPRINASKDMIAGLGALKTFQLLERKDADDGPRLNYRAAFENKTLRASYTLDKAGKIRGVMIRPEE